MQLEIQHPAFRAQRLAVETAGWLRGPQLLLNGAVIKKMQGRYTVTSDAGAETAIQLKYNYLDPIPKVKMGEEVIELASPFKWYEYAWMGGIPIVLLVSGGAIGGLCGGVAATACGRIFRNDYSPLAKYGLSALVMLGTVIAFIILATVFWLLVGVPHK